MNVPIRALGIATSILWIFLIAFLALAGYSFKDVNFGVGEPQFSTSPKGQLLFSMPMYIDNKGFYGLKQFNISTVFSDAQGSKLSSATTTVPVIPAGENVTIYHNVTLDVNDMLSKGGEEYLFNDSALSASVTAGLTFAGLLPVQISTNFSFPWGAPLYNFNLGQPSFGRFNSTHSRVMVPISFENHAPVDLTGSVRTQFYDNAGLLLGESQTALNATLGSSYQGKLELRVPLNVASSAAVRSGHFNVYFSTQLFEYGPKVIPYG